MSKRVFRLILAAYLAFEAAASFYNAFFGVRVPADIVRQLYGIFGQPVVAPMANDRARRHLRLSIPLAVWLSGFSYFGRVLAPFSLFCFSYLWPSLRSSPST